MLDDAMHQNTILAPDEDPAKYLDHSKSYHSDDADFMDGIGDEDEDNLRGVSNVVYRKEFPYNCEFDAIGTSSLSICLLLRSSVSGPQDLSGL